MTYRDQTAPEVLEKAADLLDSGRFALEQSGTYATLPNGQMWDYDEDPTARPCSLCAMGAIAAAASDCTVFEPSLNPDDEVVALEDRAISVLKDTINEVWPDGYYGRSIPNWNDDNARTKDDVVHGLRAAAQRAIEVGA